ncbi:MAG: nitroreductase family protein [Candidatus Omnitrophota bacterium]
MEYQEFSQLIASRRSIRLFEPRHIPVSMITNALDAGRLAPSAANLQFIEYLVINEPDLCRRVFPCTRWAGYLAGRRNPSPGHEPVAYLAILINTKKSNNPDMRDIGAAAQNIMLSLRVNGVGSCWLGNIDRVGLSEILAIPSGYEIDSLIAAGFPAEDPQLETDDASVRYWLDEYNQLHVPKRSIENIVHYNTVKR